MPEVLVSSGSPFDKFKLQFSSDNLLGIFSPYQLIQSASQPVAPAEGQRAPHHPSRFITALVNVLPGAPHIRSFPGRALSIRRKPRLQIPVIKDPEQMHSAMRARHLGATLGCLRIAHQCLTTRKGGPSPLPWSPSDEQRIDLHVGCAFPAASLREINRARSALMEGVRLWYKSSGASAIPSTLFQVQVTPVPYAVRFLSCSIRNCDFISGGERSPPSACAYSRSCSDGHLRLGKVSCGNPKPLISPLTRI